jgi:hypothetical protein
VTDRKKMAMRYLRLRFWVDVAALIPFDMIIIAAAFPPCTDSRTARYWSILQLLRMVLCKPCAPPPDQSRSMMCASAYPPGARHGAPCLELD